jgi:DNA-binding NtrC family response regulator
MARTLSSMLLVSRSPHVLLTRSMFARQHGWAVVEANSARSAHEQIDKWAFEALFLDRSLPEPAAQAVSSAFHEANPEARVYVFRVVGRETRVSPFRDSEIDAETFQSALDSTVAILQPRIEAEKLLSDADDKPLYSGR